MNEHSQQLSEHQLTFLNRLEKLHLKTGATWAAVAEMIGLSRTMLHHLRTGDNKPSQRTLARLEEVEIKAGIREAPLDDAGILRLLETTPLEGVRIQPADHDAGVVHVKVQFRRGSTLPGFHGSVAVKAPKAHVAAKLLSDLLRNQKIENFLRQCVPPDYASDEFLNRLEPTSFLQLVQAALEMSLGTNWRERVYKLGVGR